MWFYPIFEIKPHYIQVVAQLQIVQNRACSQDLHNVIIVDSWKKLWKHLGSFLNML